MAASLPGRDVASARVRLWRSLRDVGAASLRDGVSLIPASHDHRAAFGTIVQQIERTGGSAWVFELQPQAAVLERRLRALFDRTASYQELRSSIDALYKAAAEVEESVARRQVRQLERDVQAVVAQDFFPGRHRGQVEKALARLRARIERRFSPAEPSPRAGSVATQDRSRFRNQRWATRKRLWVDRVASAWLIRRFIDRGAEFIWLERPGDCPPGAHGFDFDGAAFTHIGELVTFEVLLESFELGGDVGLDGLARLVHYLDVGGDSVAEAAGFEALLSGLRADGCDDDALLAAATPVLDALYRHYSKNSP